MTIDCKNIHSTSTGVYEEQIVDEILFYDRIDKKLVGFKEIFDHDLPEIKLSDSNDFWDIHNSIDIMESIKKFRIMRTNHKYNELSYVVSYAPERYDMIRVCGFALNIQSKFVLNNNWIISWDIYNTELIDFLKNKFVQEDSIDSNKILLG